MFSKYKGECGKRQHHNLQLAENEYYDVAAKNCSSIPQALIKMPKRFQHDNEIFRRKRYEYENNYKLDADFNFLPNSPLLTYEVNNHSYHQQHDHYREESNEYQHQKQDRRYQQPYQRDQIGHSHQYYYSNKNDSGAAYSNFGVPPSSVHQSSVHKNNFSNNNNDNNFQKSPDDQFNGEYHQPSLPTAECLQLKSLEEGSPTFAIEQHYQHYCSYFYNQNTRTQKLCSSSGRGRKLPTTSEMPFSKKNIHAPEILLNANYDVVSAEANNLLVTNGKHNNSRAYNYVLKEKSTNNNDAVNMLENGNWHYESNDAGQDQNGSGDYLTLKTFEIHEYKNPQSFDEEESNSALLYLQKHKNKRKLRTADDGRYFYYNNQLGVDGVDNVEENINSLNICEQMKREQKLQTSNKKENTSRRSIKLPVTPTKSNESASAKKLSPPTKNRRVLIYNMQSPRLSRLSTYNIRIQRPKLKLHSETKEHYESSSVDTTSNVDNYDLDPGHMLDSASYTKDMKGISCESIKKNNGNKEDYRSYSDDNSDDDDDEDFDNDFDSSSDSDISSDSEEGYRSYVYKLTHSLDVISTSLSLESSNNSETESLENPDALLVPSLFPNVPPYLAFSSNTKKGPDVPNDLHRILKWRVTNVMPRLVRLILANSGMRLLKKTNEWMGVWGKHMKSPCFKTIRPYQKINHLPGSFKIGRKDSCWKNLVKLMSRHGKKDFGFMPKTYIIPNDLKQLRKNWPKYAQKNVKWIIKPPASARGTGIRVVDRWAQIPKRKPLIVQKYIERPLLINGSKFDLRLYVLVTSINPLRVYMYQNGLARFASVKYSDKSDTLNDRCMHLTNYSINKFSSNYSKNEDVNACHGHKWTIKSLWTYLSSRGVRTELLWAALRSLVLRTILAGENAINNMIRGNVESKYSCFELYGFDVLLDADLVPWLLEVNISPSLHSELPLDSHVKAPLVQSVLNTALYNIPPKIPIERQKEIAAEMSLPPGPICYDKRMYINYLSRSEKIKHNTFTRKSMEERDEYVNAILDHLTPDDVRCLVIAEDELARCSPLERIFPTLDTHRYLKYTEVPRYYNRLLDAWESRYANNRVEGIHLLRQYCEDQYHLQLPQIPTKKDSSDEENSLQPTSSHDTII